MAIQAYENLKERFSDIKNLSNAAEILMKDAETAMAPGSGDDRTQQIMAIAKATHRLIVAPEVQQWLDEAEKDAAALSKEDRRNLSLMRRQWVHEAGLPAHLAAEVARVGSEGEQLHTKHGKAGDWQRMKDWYQHSFDTMRAVGEFKKDQLKSASVYDALLDSFSPGFTEASVSALFADLERELPGLIQAAIKKQNSQPEPLPLTGVFPREQQAELCRRLSKAVGFDFNRGGLFVIHGHPSMAGARNDTRITTDCDENNFLKAVYSTVHETGHGLYEQNTPERFNYQPAGGHMGMAVHESQSRIIEVQACHTPEFFQYLEKEARDVFNRPDDPALSAENLSRLVNRVQPSFIRIMADELTYPAHILLRYCIERDLIAKKITVDDLPRVWNDGMQKLLGITPPDLKQGCMQDVHFPIGLIGYFPAYTLGDMGAAQFFKAACKDRPEITAEIAKGNFKPLAEWLEKNVHGKGSLLTLEELYTEATGEPLSAKAYLAHLRQRYLDAAPETPAKAPARKHTR